jgi:hypothetical protein
MKQLTTVELEGALEQIAAAPRYEGVLDLIVRRPGIDRREVMPVGQLAIEEGLVGDSWAVRGSSRTADGTSHPDMQLTLAGSRLVDLVAQGRDRWALAGDQLYVDLDLSEANLPAGTRLSIGTAVIEITTQPHKGCAKFVARFGADAMKFVNSPMGRAMRLRGVYARVVQPGEIRTGDIVRKERGVAAADATPAMEPAAAGAPTA